MRCWWGPTATQYPVLQTVNTLLEHGADVNAATPAMGWTPLHLAAYFDGADALEVVQTLIERGANVNARTRIGGWSPARVAKESERAYAGASAQAVLSAIKAAGGKDEGCDDAPMLPVYYYGRDYFSWRDRMRWRETVVVAGCEYNLPFSVPTWVSAGGRNVAGSFTAPDADEALQFVGIGRLNGDRRLEVLSLREQRGAVLPVMAFDRNMDYRGLCLDGETNTHAVVFRRSYDGSYCPWVDTVYYQYDADAGNLVEVFVDGVTAQPTGENAACRWRDTASDLDVYQDALSALRVGESPSLPWDKYKERNLNVEPLWEGLLPTRAVSTEVVETQLERLRGLPDIVRVRDAELDVPDRKIVVAEYVGNPRSESEPVDVCEGVVLAWNEAHQEWRSIYDCAAFFDIEIHDDTLSAALYVGTATCGTRRLGISCYLEIDLTTWLAELWEEPYGNYWSNQRGHPQP